MSLTNQALVADSDGIRWATGRGAWYNSDRSTCAVHAHNVSQIRRKVLIISFR